MFCSQTFFVKFVVRLILNLTAGQNSSDRFVKMNIFMTCTENSTQSDDHYLNKFFLRLRSTVSQTYLNPFACDYLWPIWTDRKFACDYWWLLWKDPKICLWLFMTTLNGGKNLLVTTLDRPENLLATIDDHSACDYCHPSVLLEIRAFLVNLN